MSIQFTMNEFVVSLSDSKMFDSWCNIPFAFYFILFDNILKLLSSTFLLSSGGLGQKLRVLFSFLNISIVNMFTSVDYSSFYCCCCDKFFSASFQLFWFWNRPCVLKNCCCYSWIVLVGSLLESVFLSS